MMEEIFDAAEIMPFEEKVLASGLCDFALPAAFVTVGGVKQAVYDSSGYTRLDKLEFKDIDEILEVLEKTLSNLRKAGEFLIQPDVILLSKRTVFQDRRRRNVKFAYVPARKQKTMDNVMELSALLEDMARPAHKNIIRMLSEGFKSDNLSVAESAGRISMLRRELKNAGLV